MEIEKNKDYEIIVFPNRDEGLKAQRILVAHGIEFKNISSLAVVMTGDMAEDACKIILKEGGILSGHYKFLYRDYEEDFFKKILLVIAV